MAIKNGETADANEAVKIFLDIYDSFEQKSLSVTTTTDSVSYSVEMISHLIKNIGNIECYINFDAAATTDSYLLSAGEIREFKGNATAIHAITATGTTTIKIIGQI